MKGLPPPFGGGAPI